MKIKLSLLMLLLTAFSYAQTTDSTSPTFVQNMEITMWKLKTLEKNITIYENKLSKLKRVRSEGVLSDILERQKRTLETLSNIYMSKNFHKVNADKFNNLFKTSNNSIKQTNSIVTNGLASMTDKERIDMLKDEQKTISINLVRSKMMYTSIN